MSQKKKHSFPQSQLRELLSIGPPPGLRSRRNLHRPHKPLHHHPHRSGSLPRFFPSGAFPFLVSRLQCSSIRDFARAGVVGVGGVVAAIIIIINIIVRKRAMEFLLPGTRKTHFSETGVAPVFRARLERLDTCGFGVQGHALLGLFGCLVVWCGFWKDGESGSS